MSGWQTTDGSELAGLLAEGVRVEVADTSDGGPRRTEPSLVSRVRPDPWNPEVGSAWLENGTFVLVGPGFEVTWRQADG